MLKIGLTGGIGSGKSTVTKYFAALEVPIIDADEIVHELLLPKTVIYKKIINHFGNEFLTIHKQLNRKKLRETIFSQDKERIWLETLLHPAVRNEMRRRMIKIQAPYCILAVPLLLETKFPIKTDRILVVDCPQKTQIQRICKRDHLTIKQAHTIIKTQIDRNSRRKQANDIIYNNNSQLNLKKIVKKLHNYYLSLV